MLFYYIKIFAYIGSANETRCYVAPDWTADWLHREARFILNAWSGSADGFATLPAERQAELQSRLQRLMRTNAYDGSTGTVTIDTVRADAFEANLEHYADVFSRGREEYAIPQGTLSQVFLDRVGPHPRADSARRGDSPLRGRREWFLRHSACRDAANSIARTWHVQLGIFWIATAWLAAGLYIAPAVSDVEPRGQRLGVNILFAALLLVVVGSLTGQWLSVKRMLGTGTAWFYLGHSGYEYIDLGRLWQIGLLIGLFLWLALMVRALRPALRQPGEQRPGTIVRLPANVPHAVEAREPSRLLLIMLRELKTA